MKRLLASKRALMGLYFALGFIAFNLVVLVEEVLSQTSSATTWQQVPIRTKAQETKNLPGGEGYQQIYNMAYAPSNPNTIYFVVDTSQVWKSTDSGDTWQMKHNGFLASGGYSLAVDPNDENIVLVYGNRMSSADLSGSAKGIYRTTNGGNTWSLVRSAAIGHSPGSGRGGTNIAFVDSSTVYAGSQGEGLLKSTNGGITWSSVNLGAINGDYIYDVKIHPDDSSVMFVTSFTDNKVYKITASGSSITQIGAGLSQRPRSMAISGNDNGNPNDDIIYAAVGTYGVYKSTNSGTNFSASNNGLSSPIKEGAKAMYITVSPADPTYLYVNFDKAIYYYSHNSGANWYTPTSMDEQNVDGWVSGSLSGDSASWGNWWGGPVVAHPSNKNIALTMGGHDDVRKTLDGGINWRYSNSGYSAARTADRASSSSIIPFRWDISDPSRMAIFYPDAGPFFSTNGGTTFKALKIPWYLGAKTTLAGDIEPVSGSQVIVTAVGDWYRQKIAVTRNADVASPSWTFVETGAGKYYPFIAFNPQNTNIIYAGEYKSNDKGYTWSLLSRRVVAMYKGNGNIVYATQTSGSYTIIYKS